MKSIYKYPLVVQDEFVIVMPEGARLLDVQVQHGQPVCGPWSTRRRIRRNGASPFVEQDTPQTASILRPTLGTFQLEGGALVFHLFARDADHQEGLGEG